MENQPLLLSEYHQQRAEAIGLHLTGSNTSANSFDQEFTNGLRDIWERPALFSSLRHAKLDPLPQFMVGDAVFNLVSGRLPSEVDRHHIIWDSHPRGMGAIQMAYPTTEGFELATLGNELPNFTQWRKIGDIYPAFSEVLDNRNWALLGTKIQAEIAAANPVRSRVMEAIEFLSSTYRASLENHTDKPASAWASFLESAIGNYLQLPGGSDAEPFSSSGLKQQTIQTLKLIDQYFGLEPLFKAVVDEKTAGNLFVGGVEGNLIRVGFSAKKSRFQVTELDPNPPYNKHIDRKAISKEDVFNLMDNGEIIPIGLPTFLAIIAASSVVPMAHLGNEYGSSDVIIKGWKQFGLENSDGYTQVTEDFRDCWSPVRVVDPNSNQSVRINLSSLVLWKEVYGLDIPNLYNKSLERGQSMEVEI